MDAKLKALFEGIISATIAGDTQSKQSNQLVKEMLTIKTQRILAELADSDRMAELDGDDDLDDELAARKRGSDSDLDDDELGDLDDDELGGDDLDDDELGDLDDDLGGDHDDDLGGDDLNDDELGEQPRRSVRRERSKFDEPR